MGGALAAAAEHIGGVLIIVEGADRGKRAKQKDARSVTKKRKSCCSPKGQLLIQDIKNLVRCGQGAGNEVREGPLKKSAGSSVHKGKLSC